MNRKIVLVGAALTFACSVILEVRSVLAQGPSIITTVAGGGPIDFPALSTNVDSPTGIAVDVLGNVYVADLAPPRILKLDAAGLLTVVAGPGREGFSGDGGPAAHAHVSSPPAWR